MQYKDSNTASLAGVYAASLTPMRDDFSCNCEELAAHCRDLMRRGCRGILLFGTTGEGPSLSVDERIHILQSVIQLGIDPQKLMIGISCSAIKDAVKLATAALDQNCSAILVVPPFFYKKVDDAGVIAFYRAVIQGVGDPRLKMVLYHIPQHSGVPITLNIIRTLREEFPNSVIGLKESEGNLEFTKEVISTFPGFNVFVGNELYLSQAVQHGAAGGISGIANAYPELICSLYTSPEHHETAETIVQLIRNHPGIPAIKCLVKSQKGKAWHVLRPPLTPLSETQSKTLLESLREFTRKVNL